VRAAPGRGQTKEHVISTTPNTATTAQPTLALRRHSIRTLTPNELRAAHGGWQGGGHTRPPQDKG
jgi:hypothetical protein